MATFVAKRPIVWLGIANASLVGMMWIGSQMNHLHILVAEDDPDIRHLMTFGLRHDGYDVSEVRDGAELLETVATSMLEGKTKPPDVIVSDVRMPGFSGLTILSGLRNAGWTTPVILVTAWSDEHVRRYARELHAAIIEKPFDIDDLRTAVLNMALLR